MALCVCVLALGAAGCEKHKETAQAPPPPVPVTVATAQSIDAPLLLKTIGSAESKARVMLRPQITARVGTLVAPEGKDVAKGDKIIELDVGPFQTAYDEAKANVDRARAVADDARRLAQRVGEAASARAVSTREVEDAEAKARAAEADVASAAARLETAQWNLSYCTISAPFAGRLGAYMVKPGAVVKENETDLVEIVETDPIDVAFSVPEENLPALREAHEKGRIETRAIPSGETKPVVGELTFIDDRVDVATGTIRLKATFANADRRLWPGRYANVTVVLGHEPDSVAVPDPAVQESQDGQAVFVVKSDQTVELRPVKVRRRLDGTAILDSGVSAGETVVTEGQLRLGPKAKVLIKEPGNQQPTGEQAAKGV